MKRNRKLISWIIICPWLIEQLLCFYYYIHGWQSRGDMMIPSHFNCWYCGVNFLTWVWMHFWEFYGSAGNAAISKIKQLKLISLYFIIDRNDLHRWHWQHWRRAWMRGIDSNVQRWAHFNGSIMHTISLNRHQSKNKYFVTKQIHSAETEIAVIKKHNCLAIIGWIMIRFM